MTWKSTKVTHFIVLRSHHLTIWIKVSGNLPFSSSQNINQIRVNFSPSQRAIPHSHSTSQSERVSLNCLGAYASTHAAYYCFERQRQEERERQRAREKSYSICLRRNLNELLVFIDNALVLIFLPSSLSEHSSFLLRRLSFARPFALAQRSVWGVGNHKQPTQSIFDDRSTVIDVPDSLFCFYYIEIMNLWSLTRD